MKSFFREFWHKCWNEFRTGFVPRFAKDERGQSTTEYILMLAIVVMIAMQFKKNFQGRIKALVDKLGTQVDSAIDSNE